MAAFGAALPSASVPTPPRVESSTAADPAKGRHDPAKDLRLVSLVRVLTPTDSIHTKAPRRKPWRGFSFFRSLNRAAPSSDLTLRGNGGAREAGR